MISTDDLGGGDAGTLAGSQTGGDFILHLSSEEKLLVIVGAAGFVLLVILLVICIVGEICPIYRCLHKHEYSVSVDRSPLSPGHGGLSPSSRCASRDDLDASNNLKRKPERANLLDGISLQSKGRDSTYSSMSDSGRHSPSPTISSLRSSKFSVSSETILEPSSHGSLSFSVQYQMNGERLIGKLNISVQEAYELPSRDYVGTCDPFVRVTLYKEKRSLRGSKTTIIGEFLTRTQRHTRSPVFRQNFAAELPKAELKECVLKLTVYDEDKYANPTELGFVSQTLRSLKKVLNSDEPQNVKQELQVTPKTFGEVLFGLSYLPTAQRLTVNIARATGLVTSRVTENPQQFCPYVRAFLLSSSGRLIKKKKTSGRLSDAAPTFDETIVFDIPHQQVEAASLLVCVFHRPPEDDLQRSTSGENMPEAMEQKQLPSRKELCVGKIAVGKHVRGDAAIAHWLAMMQNPRKAVSQWHCLR